MGSCKIYILLESFPQSYNLLLLTKLSIAVSKYFSAIDISLFLNFGLILSSVTLLFRSFPSYDFCLFLLMFQQIMLFVCINVSHSLHQFFRFHISEALMIKSSGFWFKSKREPLSIMHAWKLRRYFSVFL